MGTALSNFNESPATSSSAASANSFMHTFPRNHQPQNLRTTASGVANDQHSLASSSVMCCNPQHHQQHPIHHQQRRKTVTFLDTTTLHECANRNQLKSPVDDLPLPPPPPALVQQQPPLVLSSTTSNASSSEGGPTSSVVADDEEDSTSTSPNEEYVESRV